MPVYTAGYLVPMNSAHLHFPHMLSRKFRNAFSLQAGKTKFTMHSTLADVDPAPQQLPDSHLRALEEGSASKTVQRRDFQIKRGYKKDRFTIPSLEERGIVSCGSMPAQFIQVRTCCNAEPYQQQYALFPHEKHSEVLISCPFLLYIYNCEPCWIFHTNKNKYTSEKGYFSFQRIQGQSQPKRFCETLKVPYEGSLLLPWLTPVEYLASWISTIWLQELAYMEVKHFESLHNKQYLGLIVTVFLRSFQPLIHKIS